VTVKDLKGGGSGLVPGCGDFGVLRPEAGDRELGSAP